MEPGFPPATGPGNFKGSGHRTRHGPGTRRRKQPFNANGYFKPVVTMPLMKCFWPAKKIKMMGREMMSEAAISK